VENNASGSLGALNPDTYVTVKRVLLKGWKVDLMYAIDLGVIIWESLVLLVLLVMFGLVFGRAYLKWRGERIITCPENQRPAGVLVNTRHVLLMTLEGKSDLRLKSCSRWPERKDCGQECLRQIEAAPEDCLVSQIPT
jgi:hypothetical protein